MKRKLCILGTAVLFTVLCSCKKNTTDPEPSLSIPTTYDSTGYRSNTSTESDVRGRLNQLVNEVKKGRPVGSAAGSVIDSSTMASLYNQGSVSVASITNTYYKSVVYSYIGEAAQASNGGAYTLSDTAGNQGGFLGAYLFNEYGIEPEQMIEKGLFSAAMYNHFLTLSSGTMTPASVDRMVAIFGASPLFPATNTSSKTTSPDAFSALYAARRDKLDGNGFYTRAKNGFLKLKAALAGGSSFTKQRDEAVAEIKDAWEKAIFATVVNYCIDAKSKLGGSTPTDATKGAALHSLSEAAGFAHGWKNLPSNQRRITDAQIDEILSMLNAPSNGKATFYRYLKSDTQFAEINELDAIKDKIKAIYGFTDTEMSDFASNWIVAQNR